MLIERTRNLGPMQDPSNLMNNLDLIIHREGENGYVLKGRHDLGRSRLRRIGRGAAGLGSCFGRGFSL